MTKKNKQQNKARETLISMYIEALEEGDLPWRKGWNSCGIPHNPTTNSKYKGINILMLSYVAATQGYDDPRWCTFKQASSRGWKIKQGSKGTPIEYWMPYDKEQKKYLTWKEYQEKVELARNNDEDEPRVVLCSKISFVFNAKQIEGIPEFVKENNDWIESAPFIDTLIQNMGVAYEETGDQAYYVPSKDRVVIPARMSFKTDYDYNSVRLHELCHATGHETRLNRSIKHGFGSVDYAKEELRAEIASSFVCQSIGMDVSDSNLENHKAYIQSWIHVLQDEPDELFKAIKDAQSIEEYALEVGEWERFVEIQKETQYDMFSRIFTETVQEYLDTKNIHCKDDFIDSLQETYEIDFRWDKEENYLKNGFESDIIVDWLDENEELQKMISKEKMSFEK